MEERYGEAPHPSSWRVEDSFCPVDNVPDLYTYGQEGDKLDGLTIFKDQKTPVIGKIDDYPGIYYFLDGHSTHRTIEDWHAQKEAGNLSPWDVVLQRNKLYMYKEYAKRSYSRGPPPPKKGKTKRGK